MPFSQRVNDPARALENHAPQPWVLSGYLLQIHGDIRGRQDTEPDPAAEHFALFFLGDFHGHENVGIHRGLGAHEHALFVGDVNLPIHGKGDFLK